MRTVTVYVLFFITVAAVTAFAQSSTISIQGVLRDQAGKAVADGTYPITFNLYTAATGGSSIWTETQSNVIVQNGVFSVQLGSVNPFGASVTFNTQYYVGITFGASELTPRITLTASPYSLGLKGTSNVFSAGGNVGIGTLTPSAKLEVVGDEKVSNNLNVANRIAVGTTAAPTVTLDVIGDVKVSNTETIAGNSTINGNLTVNGTTSNNVFMGRVGIGTNSPNSGSSLDVNGPIYVKGAKPFIFNVFTNGVATEFWQNTNVSANDYVGIIAGWQVNWWNISAYGDKYAQIHCYRDNGTGNIWIHGNWMNSSDAPSWVIQVLFVRKDLVNVINAQ